uniref:Teashirt zinc finger homeobox 3b n=2 Tax=Astyanax mexicanus TaxID=7994 RepID=W5KFT9_ASTMX
MPRRKQQAPRRSAAYVPEELKEAALMDEDVDGDDSAIEEEPAIKYMCQDKDFLLKDRPGFHDSPAADLSSHEMDSESHLSESSDRMSDFESASVKNEEDGTAKEPLTSLSSSASMRMTNTTAPPSSEEAAAAGPDSLEQMKAIYTSFLTNSYWSSLNLNMTQPPPEKPPRSHSSSSSSSSSSSCGSGGYDWHQSAVAKTLQQVTQNQNRILHPASEPNLFSTVQLYRQSTKLYGSIFTGASKFRCKDCSAAYDTLVELTVHMNETGHYRDDNHETDSEGTKRWSKPRKRSLLEMEGKEDAQKVLKCMYCGHSFESLQDLSVHMIKTKHYQKVPLKEPVTPVAAKIISSARKRAPIELELPSSPDSNGGTPKPSLSDTSDLLQKTANPYITPNNRYGHQNGASYAWQFESRKSQILKCMECGSSHDTLQELTAHMMVTGHFIKVTNSAIKKGKPIMESPTTPAPTTMPSTEDKIQSVPLAATAFSPPPPAPPPPSISPAISAMEIKKEEKEEECTKEIIINSKEKKMTDDEPEEKFDISSKYPYLTEEDLEESPKGGFDILKSLENTVTSAINKAQNGTPSWGGYPSIHAAYQLPNIMKLSLRNSGKSSPLKYMFSGEEILSPTKSQPLISPPSCQTSPLPKNNFHAMEELVKKVTEKVAKVEEKMRDPGARASPLRRTTPSPCSSEAGDSARGESPKERRGAKTPESNGSANVHKDSNGEALNSKESLENGTDHAVKTPVTSMCSSTAIITDHPPEQPFVNPLSALQSVMNVHLGKAAKPALPSLDPMSMLFKMSNSLGEKAAVAASTPAQTKKTNEHLDRYFYHINNDQPIDLTKGKSEKSSSMGSAVLSSSTSTPSSVSPSSTITMAKASSAVASFMSNSPLRENALSDISDMLRNLTESHVSKSSTPTSLSERSDIDGATHEETEDMSPAQKRKGRQSNWNPQHLLILQAQFASSLRQTGDGKYIMSDLSPQERMHISRFTGLSMTTISHWLANVKYQLRRTGGTKFLKNLDSGHPVFFCSDCASQIRSPSTYVSHLESHLGFRIRDLAKLSGEQLASQITRHTKGLSEKLLSAQAHVLAHSLSNPNITPSPSPHSHSHSHSPSPSAEEEANGTAYQCKLCNRTFASKHAVKLHLSKTHGKSPEDHLLFVCELEKP